MKKSIRGAASALLAAALLASAAWAGPLSGAGEVTQKDVLASTLMIKGRSYRVTDRTVLRDAEGKVTTLRALPVAAEGGDGPSAYANYEAVETSGGLALVSLRLTQMPE